MTEEDICIRYADMPSTVKAYTVESDGFYTVILNSRLCREMNVMSYIHEMEHIGNNDFERDDVNIIEKEAHYG